MAPTSSSASDVIVVGAGTAGLAAGRNARFSHTGFRLAYAGPRDIAALVPGADPARLALPGYTVARAGSAAGAGYEGVAACGANGGL